MSAPLPSDEDSRLDSLRAHAILDTMPEATWDNLVHLASYICEVPISAISFIDQERQWFKAMTGLAVQETGREVAFCAHTILTEEGLVVHDAQQDPRFAENSLVTAEPYIRFYAGYPIHGVDGAALGALCVIDQKPRELTVAQREAMRALTRQAEQLLRLHTQEFQLTRVAEELRRVSEQQKNILSNISHEMRTPLNAISGYVHLLSQSRLTDKQMQYMRTVQESSDLLLKMVNNILDFAKIEAGKMTLQLQPLLLRSLCQNLYHILHLQAQDKGLALALEVAPEVPQTVLGDSLKLQQVLLNLLNNALKFTQIGQVTLKVSAVPAAAHVSQSCLFEVIDTGPGIAPQDQALLFEAFQQLQAPPESTVVKGTGLGLTISRELIELMGGQLQVDSTLGAGSRFYFTLPLEPASEKAIETLEPLGLRVLLLDDQEDALHLLGHYLRLWQCAVTLASTATKARDAYQQALEQQTPFDVLIIDWKMPEQDGLDFIAELQKMPPHAFPFILFVTAYASDLLTATHILSTTHGVLSKPVPPLQLHEKLSAFKAQSHPTSASLARFDAQILVVDDEPLNRHLMQDMLQQYDIAAHCVASGIEALRVLQAASVAPHLIFMDFHMPVMNGIETTEKIRALPAFQQIPIVALSANVLAQTRNAFLQAGGNDFLAKPIEPQALQRILQRYLPSQPATQPAPATRPALKAEDSRVYDKLQPLWQAGLLDWDNVYARVLGQSQLLWQLLEHFYEKARQQQPELEQLLTSHSVALQERLHALKGNASNLSLMPLFYAARDLEQNLKALPLGQTLPEVYRKPFLDAFTQTVVALARVFDAHPLATVSPEEAFAESADTLDTHALQDALNALDQTLARYDVDAIDEISGWYERAPQRLQEPVLRLKKAIAQFDYATARQYLADLRALL